MTSIYDCDTNIDRVCQEQESYTKEENRQRLAIRFLLKYLERHDDYVFRRSMALIGARGLFGHRVYRHIRTFAKTIRRNKQIKEMAVTREMHNDKDYSHILASCAIPVKLLPELPPWPVLSSELDADVTSYIISFLDDKSLGEASRVCWSYYRSLAPRQRRVTLNGCQSLPEIALWNFTGMESFSGQVNSQMVHCGFLGFLRYDHPRLAHVDLRRCHRLDSDEIASFVELTGPRLKTLALEFSTDRIPCMPQYTRFSEKVASSSSLESLSLTFNRVVGESFDSSPFNGYMSLRKLAIVVDGLTDLPKDLPNLETLELEFIDAVDPDHYWQELSTCQYPNLKRVNITISTYAYPKLRLKVDRLIDALSRIPSLEAFCVTRRERHSPLDANDDRRPITEDLLVGLADLLLEPEAENDERNRLVAFASKRKIEFTTS